MVLVAISPLALRSGSAVAPDRAYVATTVFIQVGASGIQPLKTVEGGARSGEVELQPADANGVRSKQLRSRIVQEDLSISFDGPSTALDELLDAFLDGRRTSVDILTSNIAGNTVSRALNAQVMSVTVYPLDASSKDHCKLSVLLRPESYLKVSTSTTPVPAATSRRGCVPADFDVLLDGQSIAATTLDTLVMRGDYIRGEARPGFDHPNIHVTTSIKNGLELEKWYAATVGSGSLTAAQAKRTLSVRLLPPTLQLPATLELDASGVGIVASRHSVNKAGLGIVEYELYVESWNRKGRVAPGAVTTSMLGAGPVAPPVGASGERALAAGTFAAQLPTGPFSGTGSVCMVGGENSFILVLDGGTNNALVTGNGLVLKPGTYPIAVEGTTTITAGFTRGGEGTASSFSATSGTLTITKAGKTISGSLRIVADGISAAGQSSGAEITATFTDLPRHC